MTSAQLVFKNFNLQFTKCANELATIAGKPKPEVDAKLAFPLVRGFFQVYPEIHMRLLAKRPRRADLRAFFDYVNQDYDEPTDEQFQLMKPVFYRLANTIPPAPDV